MYEDLQQFQDFQQSCNEHSETNKMMRFAKEYKAETLYDRNMLFWHQLERMS